MTSWRPLAFALRRYCKYWSISNLRLSDIALGLDVVNSRQAHLTQRVSVENEKFYLCEEEFNIADAIQKTKYGSYNFLVVLE